jgi:NitT/TauT family transport system permease protein
MTGMARLRPGTARVMLLVGLLVLWEVSSRLSSASRILVAPASDVLWQMARIVLGQGSLPSFYANAWVTVEEILAAYTISASLGMLIGIAVASSKLIGDAFEPLLLVVYAIPKIILYPLVVLMLGTGALSKIAFAVTVGLFVVIFNTAAGLRQVDPNYLRLARSLGYGAWRIFFKVQIPAAARTIFAGLRLGFGYTIIGVLTGELLVVNSGLGFLIDWASVNYATSQLYALIAMTLVLGAAANVIFNKVERRWAK